MLVLRKPQKKINQKDSSLHRMSQNEFQRSIRADDSYREEVVISTPIDTAVEFSGQWQSSISWESDEMSNGHIAELSNWRIELEMKELCAPEKLTSKEIYILKDLNNFFGIIEPYKIPAKIKAGMDATKKLSRLINVLGLEHKVLHGKGNTK